MNVCVCVCVVGCVSGVVSSKEADGRQGKVSVWGVWVCVCVCVCVCGGRGVGGRVRLGLGVCERANPLNLADAALSGCRVV